MVSIVVPAFNEAERIGDSIEKIDAFIRQSPCSFEVIVVDDGSKDETASVVKKVNLKGLRLIRNNENHGKGYNVRQGVLAASGKYVLFTDADLSAPIEELTKLLEVAVAEDAAVVIGSKCISPASGSSVRWSSTLWFGSSLACICTIRNAVSNFFIDNDRGASSKSRLRWVLVSIRRCCSWPSATV